MALTYSTADAVLKEDYKDLREQLNQSTFMLSQIETNTDDVVGLRAKLAIHRGRSSGVGARGDGGTLPTAANQGYSEVDVPLRFQYGRVQITGPTIAAMSKDRGAFTRAVKSEMDGIRNDLRRDVNRQVWGTSNGVIARCGTTSNSTTVVLHADTTAVQGRQLKDGSFLVDIGTVADSDLRTVTAREVSAVVTTAGSMTFVVSGAAITTASTDYVFRAGSGGATDGSGMVGDGQFELTGLQTIVDSGTEVFNLNGATIAAWNSTVDSNSGTTRSVSENLVNKNVQTVEIESGQQVKLLVGSDGVSRAISNLLTSTRRNIDNVELEAGYSGIKWSTVLEGTASNGPIALVYDRDAPSNRLFGLSTDQLVEFVGEDWGWMDQDGAVLSRVANADAYEATYLKYHELATRQRNAHFVIEDLTEA